ncbi:hypothetical protein ACFW9F_27600, partial [Streptomyces sp. NPDC059506]|uniref:hypothetical protein n=1 Tax=Streptomyces sp. NPDC059506 TaxID=3347751 RepID=UPI0036BB791B
RTDAAPVPFHPRRTRAARAARRHAPVPDDTRRTSVVTVLPTARHVYPVGTPGATCIRHNRLRKATAVAFALYAEFGDDLNPRLIDRITDTDMAAAAQRAGVNAPASDDTRTMVKDLLHTYATTGPSRQGGGRAARGRNPYAALAEALDAAGADRDRGVTVLVLPPAPRS